MGQGEDSWSKAKSRHHRSHQEDPASSMTHTQTEELGMNICRRQQQGAAKD